MKPPYWAPRTLWLIAGIARWTALLGAFLYLCGYALDAHERKTKEPACQWIDVPSRNAVPYVARYCYLNKETVLLRLYAAGGRQVLAERMFFELDQPNFYWKADALGYSTLSDGGFISLPPTLLDGLRARLP
ncbi:MAG TPA: hypothetical protein VLK60_02760 [Variovorax sp.]|nr:hypothetical protein [Variovorax sp.]